MTDTEGADTRTKLLNDAFSLAKEVTAFLGVDPLYAATALLFMARARVLQQDSDTGILLLKQAIKTHSSLTHVYSVRLSPFAVKTSCRFVCQ